MSLYKDLLQLIIVLLFAALVVHLYLRFRTGNKSPFLIVFILLSLLSGAFFNDIYTKSDLIIRALYPFITPFFLGIGPALYLHRKQTKLLTAEAAGHFGLAILLSLEHIVYALTNVDDYRLSLFYASQGRFSEITTSYIFSSTFELLVYPVVTSIYAIIILVLQLRNRDGRRDGIVLLASFMVALTPMLLNVIFFYLTSKPLIPFLDVNTSRLLLGLVLIPILLHTVLFHNKRALAKVNSVFSMNLSSVHAIEQYMIEEEQKTHSPLLQKGISKEEFVVTTPFPAELWEIYIKEKGYTFAALKTRVRIANAKKLIDDGYLAQYSVEALADEIGYRSRSSFYKNFYEVTGIKFKDYRANL